MLSNKKDVAFVEYVMVSCYWARAFKHALYANTASFLKPFCRFSFFFKNVLAFKWNVDVAELKRNVAEKSTTNNVSVCSVIILKNRDLSNLLPENICLYKDAPQI